MEKQIVIRSCQDVSDFVDEHPIGRSSILIVLIALGGIFVDAYDFTSLGVGVPTLKHAFGLTPFEVGSVTAMMAFGAVIGAIWGGRAADKVGRFKMFMIDLVLLVVAALGAALSVNLTMLLLFRFLLGLGVGLDFPVALSFIAEFVHRDRRASSCNLWTFVWYVAASATGLAILPFYFMGIGENLWRIAVGLGAVPALIVLALRMKYMKESAPWVAHNVSLEAAARILESTYKIKVSVASGADSQTRQPPAMPYLKELFSTQFRRRTILISLICITQSMEYFAVGFNLPSISQTLFGNTFINAILGVIAFNIFGMAGTGLCVAVTQKIGLRRILIVGYAVVVVLLVIIFSMHGILSPEVSGLLIGLLILGHGFGPSQGMGVAALSYPTRIRGSSTGWGQGMVRIGSILGFYFFPLLSASLGFYNMMGLLTLAPIIGLTASLLMNWEPVGERMDGSPTDVSAPTV